MRPFCSGSIQTDGETRTLGADALLDEREQDVCSLRQSERHLRGPNMLQPPPPRLPGEALIGLLDECHIEHPQSAPRNSFS